MLARHQRLSYHDRHTGSGREYFLQNLSQLPPAQFHGCGLYGHGQLRRSLHLSHEDSKSQRGKQAGSKSVCDRVHAL